MMILLLRKAVSMDSMLRKTNARLISVHGNQEFPVALSKKATATP